LRAAGEVMPVVRSKVCLRVPENLYIIIR
jgi:hypothetical protein